MTINNALHNFSPLCWTLNGSIVTWNWFTSFQLLNYNVIIYPCYVTFAYMVLPGALGVRVLPADSLGIGHQNAPRSRFLDIDMTILLLLACELAKGYRYFITIISVSYIVIRRKMIKRSKKLIKLMLDNIRDCDAASLFSASVLRPPNI